MLFEWDHFNHITLNIVIHHQKFWQNKDKSFSLRKRLQCGGRGPWALLQHLQALQQKSGQCGRNWVILKAWAFDTKQSFLWVIQKFWMMLLNVVKNICLPLCKNLVSEWWIMMENYNKLWWKGFWLEPKFLNIYNTFRSNLASRWQFEVVCISSIWWSWYLKAFHEKCDEKILWNALFPASLFSKSGGLGILVCI